MACSLNQVDFRTGMALVALEEIGDEGCDEEDDLHFGVGEGDDDDDEAK